LSTIKLLLEIIRTDIVIGFALYSILYFSSLLFISDKTKIKKFDNDACKIIVYIGVFYLFITVFGNVLYYFTTTKEKQEQFINVAFGLYWYAYFIELLFPIVLIQLLRIHFIKRFLIFRIIISLIFAITVQKILIIISAYNSHRLFTSNYPNFSSFLPNISIFEVIYNLLFKVLLFMITVFIFNYLKQFITKRI